MIENNNKNKNIRGGKIVGSGGYGCVFYPALKCKKNKNKNKGLLLEEGEIASSSSSSTSSSSGNKNTEKISKLMSKKNALEEYDDVKGFQKILNSIPNYQDYFLITGFDVCEPEKLNMEDLTDFKCKPLAKMGITKSNINSESSLSQLYSLNMPNGGVDIDDYLESIDQQSHTQFYSALLQLNDSLIDLLTLGIIPMNRLNVYHNDIKDSNILVDTKNGEFHTRLIDWGLSTEFHDDEKQMPRVMYRRPLQFNVPFSNILFNDLFFEMYRDFLIDHPTPSYYDIRAFMIDYIIFWNDERGPGHFKSINTIFTILFENDLPKMNEEDKKVFIELEFTYHYIIEYLTKIVFEYTKDGKIKLMDYFKNIFLKISDVWGLVTCYIPILEILDEKYATLNENEHVLYKKLKDIFMTYLYEARTEVIDIASLVKDMRSLNPLFEKLAKSKSTSSRNSKSSKTKSSNRSSKTKSSNRTSKSSKITTSKTKSSKSKSS